jgi:hypothetical protein
MTHSSAARTYACALTLAAIVAGAAPAYAQFQPRPVGEPAAGEDYHVEGSAALWFPGATILASSEEFGIAGTTIDFKNDLGLQNTRFGAFKLVGRPTRSSKFRFEFIPIKYESRSTLRRQIIFNGQRYDVGLPVNSILDWKAYRFAYEYDFLVKDTWFAGFIVEAKYTDIQIDLNSPIQNEFARARAPIPALGGIGRVYVVPNVSVTFELTGFKLPENLVEDATAHYVDLDLYGTVNFTNNVGAQIGFRSLDVGYVVDTDTGTMKLKGIYFGIVARY